MPSFINDPKTKFFMPISHIYDPIQTSNNNAFDPGLFAFLEATNGDGYPNSIPLSPSLMGIPWPSKFSGCRQCKHWETAERMTKDLLYAIYRNYKQGPQDDGKLPLDLQKSSTDQRSIKEKELLATAVKSTVYMFPDASPVRAGMIAQSMLLIFLHDGEYVYSPNVYRHIYNLRSLRHRRRRRVPSGCSKIYPIPPNHALVSKSTLGLYNHRRHHGSLDRQQG